MRALSWIRFSFVLVLLLAASGLTTAQEEVNLTLAGWASTAAEDEALREMLDAFEARNPGITVDFLPSPEYAATMQQQFASGDYPEVFYVESFLLPTWVQAGVIAPAEGNYEDIEGLYPSLVETFTVDGTFYCPPKDYSTLTLQYNRDMFDAAGLAYPTEDWTWDDLRAAAEALTGTNEDGEQVLGLMLPANLERWLPFYYQAGGSLFDEEGNLTLNTPEALEAMEFYVGMVEDGIAGPPSAVDAGWGGEAFGEERVAMVMEGNWAINTFTEQYPDLNWGVVPLPTGPSGERETMVFTVCYAVAADNEHPEESWALVNFLTGDEGARMVAEASFGPMPSRPSAAQIWLDRFGEEMRPFVDAAEYANPWRLPPGFGTFVDAFNAGLQEAFAGQRFSEDVLEEAQQVGEEILAQNAASMS